jgi:hypothetical protein
MKADYKARRAAKHAAQKEVLRDQRQRTARRDVESVGLLLRGQGVKVSDLLTLQRAHDRLLEIRTAEMAEVLTKPVTDALQQERTPEGFVKVTIPLPRYVYHGTSETATASILKEGITPRGDRTPNHLKEPSHPECVYLTDAYALAYTIDSRAGHASRGAVLEVDLEPLKPNLLPDEDAVGASGPGLDPRGVIEKMAEGSGYVSNVLYRSLYQYGTVAHRGTVPVSAIARVAYIPYASVLELVMTRRKTKLNWGAVRAQQRTILDWVFDGGETLFPVPAEELVFRPGLCEKLAIVPAGGQAKAEALMAAGVRADTLWRAHLMVHPELLNRDGIEIVTLRANERIESDTALVPDVESSVGELVEA